MNPARSEINALFAIAYRDFLKFLRNKARVLLHIGLPIALVYVLGNSLELGLGGGLSESFEFDTSFYIFTGVVGQNAFQFVAVEIISFIEERKNGFSQTMFVAPISRFTIVLGKISGATIGAILQIIAVALFGILIDITFTPWEYFMMLLITVFSGFLGGAFGTLALANVKDVKTASQIAPLLLGPQFFLAGAFNLVKDLPGPLLVLSRISPMTYAVDFARGVLYWDEPEYDEVVLYRPIISFGIMLAMFIVFFALGTWTFIRSEKNR